ncbi:hypothetical protein PIB30_101363, partial [Stylosanthes scabra]|nr:hypothetical protein [Stylosanthes scabra]
TPSVSRLSILALEPDVICDTLCEASLGYDHVTFGSSLGLGAKRDPMCFRVILCDLDLISSALCSFFFLFFMVSL